MRGLAGMMGGNVALHPAAVNPIETGFLTFLANRALQGGQCFAIRCLSQRRGGHGQGACECSR